MIKFRMYFDKDAETKWLNELCAQGYAMTHFFAGFYFFEQCEPGEYIYQVDLREKFGRVTNDYRELMTDAGIEIIQNWGYWVILRKKACEGDFELYTDTESKIEHYIKIRNMFKAVTILELVVYIIELLAAIWGGAKLGYLFAGIILILIVVLLRAVLKTNEVIHQLREYQGCGAAEKPGKFSSLLLAGFLISFGMLIVQDHISDYIAIPILLLGIIFMVVGLWQTAHKKED